MTSTPRRVALPRPPSTTSCGAGGCAGLCTETGFGAAATTYRSILLARAYRVLGDRDLAEEAVQEAMLRGWRACGTFDPAAGPVVSWLLAITGNVAVDLLRARSRRPWLSLVATDEGAAPTSRISDVDLVMLRDQLRTGLARIDALHAAALVETFLRDRPYAEVAAQLGVPAGTLRTRVHYALRRLRGELESMDQAA
jgi:RNA polymerase sigma-70 factor (ECF subfamily)